MYISAERELDGEFEPYRIRINPLDMHHVLAFASRQIGDSQTMAAEAGVLGTPFVRFNDFVGRISYLEELETRFGLGFGVRPDEPEVLLETVAGLAGRDLRDEWQGKRERMLGEKIALTPYFLEYLETCRVA